MIEEKEVKGSLERGGRKVERKKGEENSRDGGQELKARRK